MEERREVLSMPVSLMQTMNMNRRRVMVLEDDDFTRSMIVSSLQLQGIDVVCDSSSAGAAIKIAENLKPDAAVIDLDLGVGPNGIDVAIALRRRLSGIGIVILTSYEDPRLIGPNIPFPPAGSVYLVKKNIRNVDVLYESIDKAIRQISMEESLIASHRIPESLTEVTESQLDTMRLVSEGLSNYEIARLRFVSEKTVEQTISRLVKNLKIPKGRSINQRVQISRYYFKLTGKTILSDD